MNFIPLATLTGQTLLVTPRNPDQLVRFGGAELPAEPPLPVRVQGSGLVEVSSGWWDQLLIVDGDYTGPYFDGDFPTTELVQYAWTGTPHASPSTWQTRTVDVPSHPDWVTDNDRTFNLGLRTREVDHAAKTIRGKATSDEALLTDYAVLQLDTGARALQGSIRAVVDYVLGKIGAHLDETGGPDADVTAYWQLTNLLPNPSFELDTTGWQTGFGGTGLTRVALTTPAAVQGGWGGRWTANAGASTLVGAPDTTTFPVTPGDWYVFSISCYGPARPAATAIQWYVSGGTLPILESQGTTVTLSATQFSRLTVTAQAPPGASHAYPLVKILGSSLGDVFTVDGAMFTRGDEVVPYFDGDTPDGAYVYDWTGPPHAATSDRKPVVDRPPELYVWKPGTTAWAFLEPLTSSVGFRLFCDEARNWWLIDPAVDVVPGYVMLSGLNTTAGVDTISREDPEVFATGVVVRYIWTDPAGAEQIGYDTAGTPDKVVVIDYPRPFPGTGAAAAILARRNGTGRTQDISSLAVWSTSPGMVASVSLPDTLEQQGKVTSVRFSLGDDALMDVGTRGLIDIPAGAWLDTDPGEAWTDPPDISWNDWT